VKAQPATEPDRETWRIADLDPEDQEAIREAIAEFDAGDEGIPAEQVIAELRRRTEAARKP